MVNKEKLVLKAKTVRQVHKGQQVQEAQLAQRGSVERKV
jgi:hypothetical protein